MTRNNIELWADYKSGHIFGDPAITTRAKSGLDEIDYLAEINIYNRDEIPCIDLFLSTESLDVLERLRDKYEDL